MNRNADAWRELKIASLAARMIEAFAMGDNDKAHELEQMWRAEILKRSPQQIQLMEDRMSQQ